MAIGFLSIKRAAGDANRLKVRIPLRPLRILLYKCDSYCLQDGGYFHYIPPCNKPPPYTTFSNLFGNGSSQLKQTKQVILTLLLWPIIVP